LEQLHKVAIAELQNRLVDNEVAYSELHKKLTTEKELAVTETKKKQWVKLLAFIDLSSITVIQVVIKATSMKKPQIHLAETPQWIVTKFFR